MKLKDILQALRVKRKEIKSGHDTRSQTRAQSKMICDKIHAFKTTLIAKPISLDDLLKAEKAIIVFSQRQRNSEEIAKLEKTSFTGKAFNRQSSIYKLDPVLEDGVLRV